MNNLAITFICLTFLLACKDEKSKTRSQSTTNKTEAKKSTTKIEGFDCANFFKKGDYSSMCFTDAKLPENISRGCIFDFGTKGNKQEQSIKIQFAGKGSALLAEMSFDLNKTNYKKGKITAISNVGDAAFFDVYGVDLKSLSRSNKDLHVRYKNITFVLMAKYMTSTGEPCFYSNKELISFAQKIIENL